MKCAFVAVFALFTTVVLLVVPFGALFVRPCSACSC
jgi:hypothetical protein